MTNKTRVKILILAAGKGTRMESDLPKVLTPLKNKPLISWLLSSVKNSGLDDRPCIVVGYGKELVIQTLGNQYEYVTQTEMLGTGHAVMMAEELLKDKAEHVMVLAGDIPFTSSDTIQKIVAEHLASGCKITMATTTIPEFLGWHKAFTYFGRILRENGTLMGIKEYKDATDTERNITELNTSCYVFESKWLWENLKNIKNENAQKEYYITDLIKIAVEEKEPIESVSIDPHEALGANSKEELAILETLIP